MSKIEIHSEDKFRVIIFFSDTQQCGFRSIKMCTFNQEQPLCLIYI